MVQIVSRLLSISLTVVVIMMASSKKTTSLTSRDINGCKVANRIFGDDKTVIVARPGSRCSLFWFTVPEGFYALVTRHGAQMDYNGSDGKPTCVWPSGLHFGVSEIQIIVDSPLLSLCISIATVIFIFSKQNSLHGSKYLT